jgi:hypothetical protein
VTELSGRGRGIFFFVVNAVIKAGLRVIFHMRKGARGGHVSTAGDGGSEAPIPRGTLSTPLRKTDLLSNRRLRNSYFSVTLKNMHQLHFSHKKVQLHFSVKKVQLVAVALFFKLRLHFSEYNFSCD